MLVKSKITATWLAQTASLFVALALIIVIGTVSGRGAPALAADTVNRSKADAGQTNPAGLPRIVATVPRVGETEVNSALTEIVITFDREMDGGFSWTGGGPDYPPSRENQKAHWRDKRTCVLPVMLQPAHYYRVGINSTSYQNFRSADGVPVRPSAIYFTTMGAREDLKRKVAKPQIIGLSPVNGAQDVGSNLTELRVTFNMPMGEGFSWTGGGPEFPTIPEGKKPYWTEGHNTCVLPVSLKPGLKYRLGLNSPSHKNFQSAGGVPLDPVTYSFATLLVADSASLTNRAPERIGIYDSRAVAYAYFWTEDHQRILRQQTQAARTAKAAGDLAQFNKLNQDMADEQQKSHRQVFSTAPAEEALSTLNQWIPKIEKQAGVSSIVSKWDETALKKHAVAEQMDVTDLLVREFKPTGKQLKTIQDIQKQKPVPLDQIDKLHRD